MSSVKRSINNHYQYSLIINVKKSVLLTQFTQSFYKAHKIYRMIYILKNGKQTVKLFTV